jgi:CubicO group peptidase (beta-lactamase class C family)
VGSLIKTFIAIAVMQLHKQGRIGLDASASEYLQVSGAGAAVPARITGVSWWLDGHSIWPPPEPCGYGVGPVPVSMAASAGPVLSR